MRTGTIRLGDMYTPEQLYRADIMYNSLISVDRKALQVVIREEIVKPALRHINTITGIIHDPNALANNLILTLGKLAV